MKPLSSMHETLESIPSTDKKKWETKKWEVEYENHHEFV
jgi:hypothetical protein